MNNLKLLYEIIHGHPNISKIKISLGFYSELRRYFEKPENMDIDITLLFDIIIGSSEIKNDNLFKAFYKGAWSPIIDFNNMKNLNKILGLQLFW